MQYNSEHIEYDNNVTQEWLHMPDMELLETAPPPTTQIIVHEATQQMIPLDNSTEITLSEGVQSTPSEGAETTPPEGAHHVVPQNNLNHHTASEGGSCIRKPTERVTFADATTPEITIDKSCGGRDSK